METKKLLIAVGIFIALMSLMVYWFIPLNNLGIGKSNNYNFSLNSPQITSFYENLRFSDDKISYKIDNSCNLNKKYDMERAFEIISNHTVLQFYPVSSDEKISVSCQDKEIVKDENGLFIAGEGGPTRIVVSGNYNVINKGEILLIRNSNCPNPNIAIHELLHVLGFNHSANSNNIMYYMTECDQVVSQDIYDKINNLYSQKPYADLVIENVSATINGKYLDANISIKNNGLADAEASKIRIYADGNLLELSSGKDETNLQPMEAGHGIILKMTNIWIDQISAKEIEFEIYTSQQELNKENNKVKINIE